MRKEGGGAPGFLKIAPDCARCAVHVRGWRACVPPASVRPFSLCPALHTADALAKWGPGRTAPSGPR